jgi:hypothetical protein
MASNIAAMDLMKQPYEIVISWQALNLKEVTIVWNQIPKISTTVKSVMQYKY